MSAVLLVPSRRRECPGGQSLSLCWLKEKVTKEKEPESAFEGLTARSAGGLAAHLTRYGLKLRLQRGAPRLGHDKGMRGIGCSHAIAR